VIPEPTRSPHQPRRGRNNNLLGIAVCLFMIGLTVIQMLVFLIPFMALYFPLDPSVLIVMLAIGIVPTIIATYLMYKWYYSGE